MGLPPLHQKIETLLLIMKICRGGGQLKCDLGKVLQPPCVKFESINNTEECVKNTHLSITAQDLTSVKRWYNLYRLLLFGQLISPNIVPSC